MEGAGLPHSARSWLEEQGYTDGTIEEDLREIGDDEVDELIQRVENSGEGSEVERVRCALRGVRFVHLGQLRRTGFFSFFGGGRMRWSCCQSYDVEVMWCIREEGRRKGEAREKAAREKAAREKAARVSFFF